MNINGQRITDPQQILDIQMQYFSKFYTQLSENDTIEEGRTKYLDSFNILTISEESELLCDSPLSTVEMQKTVTYMANNKNSGYNGIPVEVFKKFLV